MNNALEQISSLAVWGSLIASFVLGCFMAIQAMVFARNRLRFSLLAALSFSVALVDLSHPFMSATTYEIVRLIIWSTYGPTVYFVFGGRAPILITTSLGLLAIGIFVFSVVDPGLATTTVLPLTFTLAAFSHARRFNDTHAFGSCVLLATSLSQAMACATYYWIMVLGSPTITILGYAHYASISLCAVLFGWVHVPREMALGVPVQVARRHGRAFLLTFLLAEVLVMPPFLYYGDDRLAYIIALSSIGLQAAALLLLYFYHRHQLVVYTDNVAQLLDERTQSLQAARAELARQNDIQQEKLLEQEIELNSKAQVIERQSRLELAAQTAGQAAHDIQNLLSPFVIYLERLRTIGSDQQALAQVVDVLRGNTEDLLQLNSQLLALARRGRILMEPVSVSLLIEEVLKQLPSIAPNVEVSVESDLMISGSRSQLKRALANVVLNAYEARIDARPILIKGYRTQVLSARPAHLGFLQPGAYTVLEVTDYGQGIEPAVLEHMFEPFYSTKGASSRSGSGLGLSIVAGVIEDHRGVIDVQTGSEGTSFIFYFQDISASDSLEQHVEVGLSQCLVVIGDHRKVLTPALKSLERMSYAALDRTAERKIFSTINSGAIRVILFIEETFDDAVIDLYFKIIHIQSEIKAVVLVDYITEMQKQRLLQLGVTRFFSLATPIETITKVVQEVATAETKLPLLPRNTTKN